MKNQNSRAYNFLKRGCGDRTADAECLSEINALDSANPIPLNDLLDIIRRCEIRARAVGTASIGYASSTLN